jgi:hypothetical protein
VIRYAIGWILSLGSAEPIPPEHAGAGGADAAVHNNDLQQYNEAKGALDEDVENALDAGCAVIY